jgi:hypothetical protein
MFHFSNFLALALDGYLATTYITANTNILYTSDINCHLY